MDFDDKAISLFNDSDSHFNLLVHETEDMKVYKDLNKEIIASSIDDINFKLVTVEEIISINSFYYYKIDYKNKIVGYFKPNKSIIIIPKERTQVKLSINANPDNELNNYLSLNDFSIDGIKGEILFSNYYAVYNDILYEGLVHKDELIIFFSKEEILNLETLNRPFKITEETMLYRDSNFKTEYKVVKPSNETYEGSFGIYEEGVIKFKYEGKTCWIPISYTDVPSIQKQFVPENSSDALIQSIIYQYKDKLRKSHSYYLKILRQEINKVKGH